MNQAQSTLKAIQNLHDEIENKRKYLLNTCYLASIDEEIRDQIRPQINGERILKDKGTNLRSEEHQERIFSNSDYYSA
jgi:hypothetical protein